MDCRPMDGMVILIRWGDRLFILGPPILSFCIMAFVDILILLFYRRFGEGGIRNDPYHRRGEAYFMVQFGKWIVSLISGGYFMELFKVLNLIGLRE